MRNLERKAAMRNRREETETEKPWTRWFLVYIVQDVYSSQPTSWFGQFGDVMAYGPRSEEVEVQAQGGLSFGDATSLDTPPRKVARVECTADLLFCEMVMGVFPDGVGLIHEEECNNKFETLHENGVKSAAVRDQRRHMRSGDAHAAEGMSVCIPPAGVYAFGRCLGVAIRSARGAGPPRSCDPDVLRTKAQRASKQPLCQVKMQGTICSLWDNRRLAGFGKLKVGGKSEDRSHRTHTTCAGRTHREVALKLASARGRYLDTHNEAAISIHGNGVEGTAIRETNEVQTRKHEAQRNVGQGNGVQSHEERRRRKGTDAPTEHRKINCLRQRCGCIGEEWEKLAEKQHWPAGIGFRQSAEDPH
ncbi:hypothetical protein C8R43DRAFT_1106426 [Mycena crocata]|nr:hypothetical protein C8R43DRAFT_1106426 [Mycena crocata]